MNPSIRTKQPILARVDGWAIHIDKLETAIAAIISKAHERCGFSVFTLNLDHLVKLRTNAEFRRAYRTADIVTADGEPVAWLSRQQQANIQRTTGADMFVPLVAAAAANDLPIYLFGATEAVLAKTASALSKKTEGRVKIAGISAPSGTFDPSGPEADAAIAAITASGAALCFVALGAPKQELFASRAIQYGCKCGFVCVGAAVDFVAGSQVRAPEAFQRLGMEWAWRLITNPRRLATRYASCARVLFDIAVVAPVREQFISKHV